MELDDLLRLVSVPSLLSGGGDPLAAYHALIASLNLTLYTRHNETSGNLINHGSDGNSATVSGATQGQTGQLGANEAYLSDGVDDLCTFPNASIASTKILTTQRWMFLINAAALGEDNTGTFFAWGDSDSEFGKLQFLSSNRMRCTVDAATTNSAAITNTNQVTFLASWALVFMDYDDADSLGLGRKIRLMVATAAAATQLLTLATDTAAVGAAETHADDLIIGNKSSAAWTFSGLIDETGAGAGLWSPALAPTDLTLCDQFRSLVFGV